MVGVEILEYTRCRGGSCRIVSQQNSDKTTGEHQVLYWIINWMLNLVLPRKLIVPLDGMKNVLHICHFLPLCNNCVQNIHGLLSIIWEFSVLDVYVEPWKPSRIHHENTKKCEPCKDGRFMSYIFVLFLFPYSSRFCYGFWWWILVLGSHMDFVISWIVLYKASALCWFCPEEWDFASM